MAQEMQSNVFRVLSILITPFTHHGCQNTLKSVLIYGLSHIRFRSTSKTNTHAKVYNIAQVLQKKMAILVIVMM